MNDFTEGYLRNLAADKVQGDFPPFNKGDIGKIKRYIKGMLGRLSDNRRLNVEADYSAYGSGFASYINVKISKKDKSDTTIIKEKKRTVENKDGVVLYISLLSPYWYFGQGEWWDNYSDGSYIGGGGGFLTTNSIKKYNKSLWEKDVESITALFDEYRYRLLTKEELEKPLGFDVLIKSNFLDRELTVFDCFFHWED
jgi:hypothetical protein